MVITGHSTTGSSCDAPGKDGPVADPAKTASIFPRAIGFVPSETPASLAD
jgi:hypothetical protein